MCSEAVWWRCHRRIVADYLLLRGRSVLHLMGSNRAELAKMNEGARRKGAELVSPAAERRSRPPRAQTRKSVVQGRRGSVRGDLGGGRIHKNTTTNKQNTLTT